MTRPLLQVRGLCKYFPIIADGFLRKQVGQVKAVDGLDFDLAPGTTLGLVGESGCGKTTAARCILRALRPTSGSVLFDDDGRSVDLANLSDAELKPLRTRLQMVFQDPFASLNPRFTIERIVAEPLLVHGLGDRASRRQEVVNILERVGLGEDHLKRYPHEFSGGQRQRIGIARALILKPRLIVCDEAVSALDVSVQAQVINLLKDLQEEFGLTYIFVAHDLSVVRHIADEVAVMYAGRIVEHATCQRLFNAPQHPYTRALLAAVPHPDPDRPLGPELGGEVADTGDLPSGCAFHPRCRDCFAPCDQQLPRLQPHATGGRVACHLYDPATEPAPATLPA